jgi:hypothetical protein
LLVEYWGLGVVVRYQHQEDDYTNTFRALRVTNETGVGGWGDKSRCPRLIHSLCVSTADLLIAEFTDDRVDFNFRNNGSFFELFDLKADPFQLRNIFNQTPPHVWDPLLAELRALFKCQGATCN